MLVLYPIYLLTTGFINIQTVVVRDFWSINACFFGLSQPARQPWCQGRPASSLASLVCQVGPGGKISGVGGPTFLTFHHTPKKKGRRGLNWRFSPSKKVHIPSWGKGKNNTNSSKVREKGWKKNEKKAYVFGIYTSRTQDASHKSWRFLVFGDSWWVFRGKSASWAFQGRGSVVVTLGTGREKEHHCGCSTEARPNTKSMYCWWLKIR